MSWLGDAKTGLNKLLSKTNIRIDSRTAERAETARLEALEQDGHFQKPVFPVLQQFAECDPSAVWACLQAQAPRFRDATRRGRFPLENDYYTTPDAEVLFAIVRLYRPAKIIEIGSGNSTHLFRLAIEAEGVQAKIISIDPDPRRDVRAFCDELIQQHVETLPDFKRFEDLQENDILFIDSSHEVKAGNDVLCLVLSALPRLSPGVVIHFHDIFLPFDYPRQWIVEHRWPWAEQYLLQAFLTGNQEYEVLWPGHYLQRTCANFKSHFTNPENNAAKNFWMVKR